jgi:pyruvate dehydrogenase E1 component
MPSLPPGVEADLLRGLYRLVRLGPGGTPDAGDAPAQIRLLGSGAILREVLAAAETLAREDGVCVEVFSATSYAELAREAEALRAQDIADPQPAPRASHLGRLLPGPAPVLAASDYVRAWPQRVAEFLAAPFMSLGTDGFGCSDTRERLRRHFGVDAAAVRRAALAMLRRPAD